MLYQASVRQLSERHSYLRSDFKSFQLYKCNYKMYFSYIYVRFKINMDGSAHMSAVLVGARRGRQIPLELELHAVVNCLITVCSL